MGTHKLTTIKNEKGMAIVYMAILIAVLVAMAGLAVDIGYMYVAKGQLQNAADGAALAGAAKLDETNYVTQTNARDAAFSIASSNSVVGEPVKLALNTSNAEDGDIVVGNWNNASNPKFLSTRQPVNAVKVVARRTNEPAQSGIISSDNRQVKTFFGSIFSVIVPGSAGFPLMSAVSEAIAAPPSLLFPGIVFCDLTCDATLPLILDINAPTTTPPPDNGMAWTAFSYSQAPDVGANGDVVAYITGNKTAPDPVCGIETTTNNGGSGGGGPAVLGALKDQFEINKRTFNDGSVGWKVAIPIVDFDSSGNSACPPGSQGNKEERYKISRIATVVISQVNTTGSTKGITISKIDCVNCSVNTNNPPDFGKSKLVN
jgi:Flp pilus assembly protein TadG